MGIGNTTAASALTAVLTGTPVEAVTGRGTGVDDAVWRARSTSSPRRSHATARPRRRARHAREGRRLRDRGSRRAGARRRRGRVPVVVDGFIAGRGRAGRGPARAGRRRLPDRLAPLGRARARSAAGGLGLDAAARPRRSASARAPAPRWRSGWSRPRCASCTRWRPSRRRASRTPAHERSRTAAELRRRGWSWSRRSPGTCSLGELPARVHPVVWMGRAIDAALRLAPRERPRRSSCSGRPSRSPCRRAFAGAGVVAARVARAGRWLRLVVEAWLLRATFALRALGARRGRARGARARATWTRARRCAACAAATRRALDEPAARRRDRRVGRRERVRQLRRAALLLRALGRARRDASIARSTPSTR